MDRWAEGGRCHSEPYGKGAAVVVEEEERAGAEAAEGSKIAVAIALELPLSALWLALAPTGIAGANR